MNEIQQSNLNQLEAEITVLKHQTAQNIIEIGKRLIQAKELVVHGEWESWLDNKVKFSRTRARQFMQVAREFGNQQMSVDLTLDKMLELTSLDPKERETFIEENPVEDMTTRELRQAVKENNQLKEEKDRLARENKELKSRQPEVIEKPIPVTPADYEELKNRAKNSIDKDNFNRLKKEFEEKIDENHELKKQLKSIEITSTKEQHQSKIRDTAIIFSNRVHSFINDVGGLGWLIDYLGDLPIYEKQEYIKALELLDRWVTTIKSNIDKGDLNG